MTTSNKLLLGFFVAAVLALTSTHIALYAKYKAGDFEKREDAEKDLYITHQVPAGVKGVRLIGFDNCSISHNGEPGVKVPRNGASKHIGFTVNNDTLVLMADTTRNIDYYEQGQRNDDLIRITLPLNVHLRLDYSSLNLPSGDSTTNYNIRLNPGSRLGIMHREPMGPAYFGKLNITARHAVINLDDFTRVNELTLTGEGATLDAHNAIIKNLHLNVDSTTIITTTRNGLQNLQLVQKP